MKNAICAKPRVTVTKKDLRAREWDPSEWLDTDDKIRRQLEACSKDANPRVLVMVLQATARALGMTELARRTGITRESLYKSLGFSRNPRLDTVLKIVRALGLEVSLKRAKKPTVRAAARPRVRAANGNGNGNGRRARKTA